MRIKKLIYEDRVVDDPIIIRSLLEENNLVWLNKAEIENAVLEIKDGKLYWHRGVWFFGNLDYIIWLDGEFRGGEWYNGVWYNGVFKNSTWHNGIFMNGVFENSKFVSGEFRKGVKKNSTFPKVNEKNKISLNLSDRIIKFNNF